jgi:hypothetical protein
MAPLDTNVTQAFFPSAANAVDFAEYLKFQVGFPKAENFVIAASVLFEYLTAPACNKP